MTMSSDQHSIAIPPYTVARIELADVTDLQRLFDRCPDYFTLQELAPARPDAAARELANFPPGQNGADKFPLGIYVKARECVGYLDLARDYPEPGVWSLGFLLLEPSVRGSGLGSRVYQAARRWVASLGATAIDLCVLETNPSGERFWRCQGFQETRRQKITSLGGQAHRVIVMRDRIEALNRSACEADT